MKIQFFIRYLLLPAVGMTSFPAVAAGPNSAIAIGADQGSVELSLRYRFEQVDQDNTLEVAQASTLKARLTAYTAVVGGWSILLETDYVTSIGPDHYNSLSNGNTSYSVVADPVGADLNQALISHRLDAANKVTAGRQRIVHSNQRFVGGVGWRQNEQTYDALSYNFQSGDVKLSYSYVWNVNRIFSGKDPSTQEETFQSDSHLLMASWKDLNVFGYALDFDNAPAASSLTIGLEYKGTFDRFSYGLGIARQDAYGSSTLDYDALHFHANGSYDFTHVTLSAGYEVLGSDEGTANFSTPLATLHAFQGWADGFLNTGTSSGLVNGLKDRYVGLSGKIGDLSLSGTWHDFSSDERAINYGSELDLAATLPLAENFSAQAKFASFNAEQWSVDTSKVWLTLNYTF